MNVQMGETVSPLSPLCSGVGRDMGLPQSICISIDKHYCTALSVLQFTES